MKQRIILALAVLMLAVPAFSAVTITATDLGGGLVEIAYTADVNVSAFALDITVDAGTITDINSYIEGASVTGNIGYGIFPGTIVIDGNGTVTDNGTPVAPSAAPGALGGLGTAGITIEMGALYEDGNEPPLSGILCRITVSGTVDASLCITANATRGNVVRADASQETSLTLPCNVPVLLADYALTPSSTTGGDVTTPGEAGPYYYGSGTDADIVASPSVGYSFVNWTGTGVTEVADPNAASTTITMTDDYTVVANFAIQTFTVTTTSGANGSVDPNGAVVVDYGNSQQFTATADSGYDVNEWDLDGSTVQVGGVTYTLSNVTANHTVNVTFVSSECYTGPDYSEWLSVGSPNSWCYPRQCHGDADGLAGAAGHGTAYVQLDDLDILVAAWWASSPSVVELGADFDHSAGAAGHGTARVQIDDLNILVANWWVNPDPNCLD